MQIDLADGSFSWDPEKESKNVARHGADFAEASRAFFDPSRIIKADSGHSQREERFFCIGMVKNRVMTVRFVLRFGKVRIIGAGYWRKGRKVYEKEKNP